MPKRGEPMGHKTWVNNHPYSIKEDELTKPITITFWSPVKEAMMKVVIQLDPADTQRIVTSRYVKRDRQWVLDTTDRGAFGIEDAMDMESMYVRTWATTYEPDLNVREEVSHSPITGTGGS